MDTDGHGWRFAPHGFVPEEVFQELRSLLRTRKQLVNEQTRHTQRIQKLEDADVKLDSVISDILGVSGRRMIEAMIEGERNPTRLAALADGRLKAKPKALHGALRGRLTDHHRFGLGLHMKAGGELNRMKQATRTAPPVRGPRPAPACTHASR